MPAPELSLIRGCAAGVLGFGTVIPWQLWQRVSPSVHALHQLAHSRLRVPWNAIMKIRQTNSPRQQPPGREKPISRPWSNASSSSTPSTTTRKQGTPAVPTVQCRTGTVSTSRVRVRVRVPVGHTQHRDGARAHPYATLCHPVHHGPATHTPRMARGAVLPASFVPLAYERPASERRDVLVTDRQMRSK